jgi:hypothetical protein
MPDILDLALRNRIVEFSDQLDREGYTRSEQLAVLGGLVAICLGMMPPAQRRLAAIAHLAALADVVPDLIRIKTR